ncbi:uncharacterized protein LOC110813574 isoform X2 [Carica papaya]|uniref:uncharacterized protein LOC110813574 isoform X2 n=1 Tax=Carica papaya TaxID=3649 RepID=UPI000B8CDE15|nr:uncharacterized protein LOC110813574 isoform X2 [Carica papaya]
MATARLLRASTPWNHGSKGEKKVFGDHERKSTVLTKVSEARVELIDVVSLLPNLIIITAVKVLNGATKWRPVKLQIQSFIERVVIDCRFFTLFAVAGSLLGSILCFLEGCFLVLEAYFKYFQILSQRWDEGEIMRLLIEAMDMFLVGTAMLIFGVGIHVMFVGSRNMKQKLPWLPHSNLFGLFSLKTLPKWVEMESVSQAKLKIGHTVMMILQAGVLEKFKSVPLVTSLDLACFAGAVVVSSACIFLLSRLSTYGVQ